MPDLNKQSLKRIETTESTLNNRHEARQQISRTEDMIENEKELVQKNPTRSSTLGRPRTGVQRILGLFIQLRSRKIN